MSDNKSPMFDYDLRLKGIFGRNRTVKTEIVRLARVPRDTPRTPDDLMPDFRTALAALRPKPGAVAQIVRSPIEIEKVTLSDGRSYETVSFTLFSASVIHTETVGA